LFETLSQQEHCAALRLERIVHECLSAGAADDRLRRSFKLLAEKFNEPAVGFKGNRRKAVKGVITQFSHIITCYTLTLHPANPVSEDDDSSVINAILVETTDKLPAVGNKAGLFLKLPQSSLLHRLIKLYKTTREAPLSACRLNRTLPQQQLTAAVHNKRRCCRHRVLIIHLFAGGADIPSAALDLTLLESTSTIGAKLKLF
jgi:hypothetical protein